jgi:hypothetical protein
MRYATALMMLILPLGGCHGAPSSALPDEQQYSKATQMRAAEEMKAGSCPTLNRFTVDYGVMRDQTKAIRKRRQK